MTSRDWEGRFRCFAYQRIYDGFNLAQSGEAKCNLYSAKEGDRTMTLKTGIGKVTFFLEYTIGAQVKIGCVKWSGRFVGLKMLYYICHYTYYGGGNFCMLLEDVILHQCLTVWFEELCNSPSPSSSIAII